MTVEYPWLVKFHKNEDGEREDNQSWHMTTTSCGDPCALCSGQHFGFGLGEISNEYGLDYEEKQGKVTCEECRAIIKRMKKVKL